MFKELDTVALEASVPQEAIWHIPADSLLRNEDNRGNGLLPGDVGTLVHTHAGGEAFEVEFLEQGGYTVAIATLAPSQIRLATEKDLASDRFWHRERTLASE